MRNIDVVFQKNLGWAMRAVSTVKTPCLRCLNPRGYRSKKIIKTACENFHDGASFHALRQKLVFKPGDFIPLPGVFY
jgi:hypothetical protein